MLTQLGEHRDIGIHTEMFSDGVVDLVYKGVITNSKKTIQTGKIVSSFAFGSKKLYNFMNNNPFVGMSKISTHTHTHTHTDADTHADTHTHTHTHTK